VSGAQATYRASALGGCRRALLAARQGMIPKPPPEKFTNEERTGIFDRGEDAEDLVIPMLIEQGFAIHHQQQEVELCFPSMPSVRVLGHIDALTEPGSKFLPAEVGQFTHLLEIKRFGAANWKKWIEGKFDAFPQYAVQVAVYMHALELADLCMVIHNGETGDYDISWYERPPRELWELEALVAGIEEANSAGLPLSEVECTKNYPCPFYYLHDLPLPLPSEAIMFAKAINLFDQRIKTLQTQQEAFKEKLRERLEVGSYQTGEVSVSVADGDSTRLDTAKVKALLDKAEIPLSDYQTVTHGKKRLTVTVRAPQSDPRS
jgi:hypothetical protein